MAVAKSETKPSTNLKHFLSDDRNIFFRLTLLRSWSPRLLLIFLHYWRKCPQPGYCLLLIRIPTYFFIKLLLLYSGAKMSTGSNQILPPKELAQFRKILKCYEQKQYKNGLRCAKQILANPTYADHGETLAMKGLILNCMGKHEEALEVVRKGLTANLKSHICWHVFGLVQRSDKKYDEAMKAYKMALRIDRDNLQFCGYRDSRHQILVHRPSTKMSWIGYANACHLLGDYDMALNIIKDFRKNNRPASQYDFENSELVLYEVMILREAGNPEFALTKLEENAACVIDRVSYLETRAELLMDLGKLEEAEQVYWGLIDRNADNFLYYSQIEKCQGIDNKTVNAEELKVKNIYEKAIQRKPKASIPQLLILFSLSGKAFEDRLLPYLVNGLRKGIPSLFKNLAPLYDNPAKTSVIEKILLDFVRLIEENGYDKASLDGSSLPECPTTVLWVYYYLAQHFDRLKNYTKAHKFIDVALKHTPTLIELYMVKAKIFKHSGDMTDISTASVQISAQGWKTSGGGGYCMWYELECAKAYNMLGKHGEALKKCHQVERHFVSFYEDQYDFHSYCIRKMTLCSYVKVLRFEDTLNNHRYYIQAAKLAASIYIDMVERPECFNEKIAENEENMSVAELRKLRRKANKAKAVEEKTKQSNQVISQQAAAKRRIDGELDVIEPEPLDPQKLLKVENPIEEAAKFIKPILILPCKDIEVMLIGLMFSSTKIRFWLCCNVLRRLMIWTRSTRIIASKMLSRGLWTSIEHQICLVSQESWLRN
uniref:N-alpha-acetyltransferase 16, NatA auxiliary subunit n=1 Tax=Ditylenchus dipsaci TaxID=166011 RepID=A0A915D8S6_9BILA